MEFWWLTLSFLIIEAIIPSLSLERVQPSKPKEKNLSFAIPAFLLGGGLGIGTNANPNAVNNGNLPNINSVSSNNNQANNQNQNFNNVGNIASNFFRQVTVTRTLLSTTATVTMPVYRTCVTTNNQFSPCAAGRKKRSAAKAEEDDFSMMVIIGSTTVTDQAMASVMLNLDGESFSPKEETKGEINMVESVDITTMEPTVTLYPSEEVATTEQEVNDPDWDSTLFISTQNVTPQIQDEVKGAENGMGRLGLAGTTTVTRIIPVVAVVNSTVSTMGGGGQQTLGLTVSYLGCSPPTLPYTGINC